MFVLGGCAFTHTFDRVVEQGVALHKDLLQILRVRLAWGEDGKKLGLDVGHELFVVRLESTVEFPPALDERESEAVVAGGLAFDVVIFRHELENL